MAEYSLKLEDAKRASANKVLEDSYPLVAIKYDQGIMLATVNPLSNIKKIREVYPGILFGAIGEIPAINLIFEDLVNIAHYRELTFSSKDVRLTQLIKEISQTIWKTFVDGRYRPIICEFIVIDQNSSFAVSFDGSVEEVRNYAVLASSSKQEKIESQLKDYRPEMTLSEVTDLVHKILGKENLELITLPKKGGENER